MLRRTSPLILAALAAACASTARDSIGEATPERSPAAIAGRLADAAVTRADPNHMRVLVHFRRPDDPVLEVVAPELERELVTALSGRFHLFDSGLAATSETWQADLDEQVERLDVTHVLVCDTAMRNGEIVLSMRLVEHDSLRIVATSQGSFPVEVLTDSNRVALTAPRKTEPLFVIPPAASRLARVETPEPLRVASAEPPPVARKRSYDDYESVRTIPIKHVSPEQTAPLTNLTASAKTPLALVRPKSSKGDADLLPPPLQYQQDPDRRPSVIYHGPASRRLKSTGRELKRP